MYRISLIAITSLFLSAALTAEEPNVDMEAIATPVMIQAFQVADYDTVEALFDKLSLESKKKFLQEAVAMSEVVLGRDTDKAPQTALDVAFMAHAIAYSSETKPEAVSKMFGQWAPQKQKQTQLLGRLVMSLFEPTLESHSTPYKTHGGVVHAPHGAQPVPPVAVAPPGLLPCVPPVPHDDGYVTLGSYGRVYIKGLDASEMRDAFNFHLARYIPKEKEEKGLLLIKMYYVGDIMESTNLDDTKIKEMLTTVIEPKSWHSDMGGENLGEGYVTMHAPTQSLAVRQTPEIHAQIEDLISQLRTLKTASESPTPVR